MTKTHWLQNPNKNYLGHWDLPNGDDVVLTIDSAKWEDVKDPTRGTTEKKRVIRFKEDVKPMICNQTNAQSIITATGVRYMEDTAGKQIRLCVENILDRRTKESVDCIRVRRDSPRVKEVLDKNHPKWEKAKENVKSGSIDLVGLRTHWIVSNDIYNLLLK